MIKNGNKFFVSSRIRLALFLYETNEKSAEDIIKEIREIHQKILIIVPHYDEAIAIDMRDLEREGQYTQNFIWIYDIENENHKFNVFEKGAIVQYSNVDSINSEIHPDCVIYYNLMTTDVLLLETEKGFICPSNPRKEVHIYHISEYDDEFEEEGNRYLKASIGWREIHRRIGNKASEPLTKYMSSRKYQTLGRFINRARRTCSVLSIPLDDLDPLSFTTYCFPFLYKSIRKIRKINEFALYQKTYEQN